MTCLSTSINTPNHQSAFVCLVAQMKNLVNIHSKKSLAPTKSVKDLAPKMKANKTKYRRSGRTAIAATTTTISSTPNDKAADECFAWQNLKPTKKIILGKSLAMESARELPKVRSTRLASNALKSKILSTTATNIRNKSKENKKRTNAKINEIHKLPAAAISKAKSRKKQSHTKSKVVNIVALANSVKVKGKFQKTKSETNANLSTEPRKTRKRKLNAEADTEAMSIKPSTLTTVSTATRTRKSSRLSSVKQTVAANQKQISAIPWKKQRKDSHTSMACFSPPLTRARLKNLEAQGKATLLTVTEIKKRRI